MMMNLVGAVGLVALSSFGGLQPKQSYVWSDVNSSFIDVSVNIDDFNPISDIYYQVYKVSLDNYNIVNTSGVIDTRSLSEGNYLYIYKWYSSGTYNFAFAVSGLNLFSQYQTTLNRLIYSVNVGENNVSSQTSCYCYYNYSNGSIQLVSLKERLEEWQYYDQSESYPLVYSPYMTHDYYHGFKLMDYSLTNYPFVSLYDYGYQCSYTRGMNVEFVFRFGLNGFDDTLIQSSYDDGYDDGYYEGEAQGYSDGYQEGSRYGYDNGYAEGLFDGRSETHYSFTDLFGAIADTPVLIVRNLFDFDLFGVNVLTIVMSLFTAMILFYLFRKLL